MAVVSKPRSFAVFFVSHDWVYIIDGPEVFTRPFEVAKLQMGGMSRIETTSLPLAN